MNGLNSNGAGPFFKNLFPIRVHMIHILLFAVLDSRSRTAQARVAISLIPSRQKALRSKKRLLAGKYMNSAIAHLSSTFRCFFSLLDAGNWWCMRRGVGAFEHGPPF